MQRGTKILLGHLTIFLPMQSTTTHPQLSLFWTNLGRVWNKKKVLYVSGGWIFINLELFFIIATAVAVVVFITVESSSEGAISQGGKK